MNNPKLADILDPRNDLLEESARCVFVHFLILDNIVKQFSARRKLHDQIQLLGGLNDLVQLNKVGVLDYFQNVDLTRNSLNICNILYLALFENFDSNL